MSDDPDTLGYGAEDFAQECGVYNEADHGVELLEQAIDLDDKSQFGYAFKLQAISKNAKEELRKLNSPF